MRVASHRLQGPLLACVVLASLGLGMGLDAPRATAWVPYRTDGGIPIAWPPGTLLDVAIRVPLPADLALSDVLETAQSAFDAWLLESECHPPQRDAIRTDTSIALDDQDGVIAIVFFSDEDAWRALFGPKELAHTLVRFDPATGAIRDADIAVNTARFVFDATPGEACSAVYDLRAALTHEVGHVLGLDHSLVPAATMDEHELAAACDKRDLDPDDRAGLCALYAPPEPADAEADNGPETPPDGTAPDDATIASDADASADRMRTLPPDCGAGGSSLPMLSALFAQVGLVLARRRMSLRGARRSSARCPRERCPSRVRS